MEILLIIMAIGGILLIVWLLFMLITSCNEIASDFYFNHESFFNVFLAVALTMYIVPILIWAITMI